MLEEAGIDARVRTVMERVPRHRFVPPDLQGFAYEDAALPIGFGQTISQPSLVGLMTEKLALGPNARVLEVGTGSGYQTAILAELASEVCSIEIVPELGARARKLLAEIGCANISFRGGDGYAGWPEKGPFDAIIVTASAPRVPKPLIDQLRTGGRMVIPVIGDLLRVTRRPLLPAKEEWLCAVQFVPMIGAVRN